MTDCGLFARIIIDNNNNSDSMSGRLGGGSIIYSHRAPAAEALQSVGDGLGAGSPRRRHKAN